MPISAQAIKSGGGKIVGIGVDFTSCTMLPALCDGTPLCLLDDFKSTPLSWPKLWKHHGAKSETDRINQIARERNEPWLARYGGRIGLEWFFPKVLETLNHAPHVYDKTEVWSRRRLARLAITSGPYPAATRITSSVHLPGRIQSHVEPPKRLSVARLFSPPFIRASPMSSTKKCQANSSPPASALACLRNKPRICLD